MSNDESSNITQSQAHDGAWIGFDTALDWELGGALHMTAAKATGSFYVEAGKAGNTEALDFAKAQIEAGKSIVIVAIGGDRHLYAGSDDSRDFGPRSDDAILAGHALADTSEANFLGVAEFENPISAAAAVQATISGNMDTAHLSSLQGADITVATSTNLSLRGPGVSLDLSGSGFTYDSYDLITGGTTSRIEYVSSNFRVNLEAKVSAANFGAWVATDATQQAFATILSGADSVSGSSGVDLLRGYAGDDWVVGGQGGDSLFGEAAADVVYGNMGADNVYGGDGNDTLRGGKDNDMVEGGAGNDWIAGDRGADTLSGGSGADLFHSFSGAGLDRILDFSYAAGDRLNLHTGTTYTVSQVGSDTVVSLGGGDQVVLAGVAQTSLGAGWITVG